MWSNGLEMQCVCVTGNDLLTIDHFHLERLYKLRSEVPFKGAKKSHLEFTQKLTTLVPPPGSSDWSIVLELMLMSGTVCKSLNSVNLTQHLKNAAFMCETLQKILHLLHSEHLLGLGSCNENQSRQAFPKSIVR